MICVSVSLISLVDRVRSFYFNFFSSMHYPNGRPRYVIKLFVRRYHVHVLDDYIHVLDDLVSFSLLVE
jgi:hypothetical protein